MGRVLTDVGNPEPLLWRLVLLITFGQLLNFCNEGYQHHLLMNFLNLNICFLIQIKLIKAVKGHYHKTLKDEFVIRIKLSRNSSEISVDKENKPRYLKLKNVKFAKSKRFPIKKLVIKNKVYQKATCLIEYDDYHIEKQTYTAVRVTLKDCQGQKIFKEPMLLLTNRKIKTLEQAYGVYFIYMQRSKIENVFKFLKEILGWEEFQVRDFESIKNIVALCFFVGGYFYEIESELIENVNFQYLCDLGGGKGQYTRHFFLKEWSRNNFPVFEINNLVM